MTFDIKLEGQKLILPEIPHLAEGAKERVRFRVIPDEEWAGLAVTMTFRCVYPLGLVARSVLIADHGESYAVPHEVLRVGYLCIGATGHSGGGSERLTTSQIHPICVHPREDDGVPPSEEITPELAEQLLAAWTTVGSLTELKTEDKSSLVAAINELAGRKSEELDVHLRKFGEAFSNFTDGDALGLPVYDPCAESDFVSMLIMRGADEPEGNIVHVLSEEATRETIASMTGGGNDGSDGADGYTPVRGEDYFTPEDVAEIVSEASAQARAEAVEEALSVMRAPTLAAQDTWYKGSTARTAITEIRVLDSFTPSETDVVAESWEADVDGSGEITCYVLTDAAAGSSVLVMAGNGSGRIMANADSKFLFAGGNANSVYSAVESISGLELIDTRYVQTLQAAFNLMSSLHTCTGYERWNVSRCQKFRLLFNGNSKRTELDLSAWDVSAAVAVADDGKNVLDNSAMGKMLNNCHALRELRLPKSFDVRFAHLPAPREYDGQEIETEYLWLDIDTCQTYGDVDNDEAVTADGTILYAWGDREAGTVGGDGVINPAVAGRNVTLVAVAEEGEVDV